MKVYYDPTDGRVLYTLIGDDGPVGACIEVPDEDLGDLAIWWVIDGELVRRPDWETILLVEARTRARLSRVELAVRLAWPAVGILSPADAAQFARGDVPTVLQPLIDTLDAEAMIRFFGATEFDRLDPTLCDIAQEMGVTETVMDVVFGLQAPPPPEGIP